MDWESTKENEWLPRQVVTPLVRSSCSVLVGMWIEQVEPSQTLLSEKYGTSDERTAVSPSSDSYPYHQHHVK